MGLTKTQKDAAPKALGVAIVAATVLGSGHALIAPALKLPFWIEGQSWTHPENCPICGERLTRRDAEFVECKACTIQMTRH
jgi:hypothetical protein